MRQQTIEQLQVEKIARQLCTAAGEDPNRVLSFVAELSPADEHKSNVTRFRPTPATGLRLIEVRVAHSTLNCVCGYRQAEEAEFHIPSGSAAVSRRRLTSSLKGSPVSSRTAH
jgi:hypothetical protein